MCVCDYFTKPALPSHLMSTRTCVIVTKEKIIILNKGKVCPVHIVKAHSGVGIAPLILDLSIVWRRVVKLTIRPLLPP